MKWIDRHLAGQMVGVACAAVLMVGCASKKPSAPVDPGQQEKAEARSLFNFGKKKPAQPAQPTASDETASSPRQDAKPVAALSQALNGTDVTPKDASPALGLAFRIEVYRVSVPLGTISANEKFWKRVNEQVVTVGTYDVLWKNGMRVGLAPLAEWDYFADLIKQNPGTSQKMATLGTESKNLEMEMRTNMPEQNLFWFDQTNQLRGRSFDRSDNIFTLSFSPAPRKPGTLRVALCPVVRSQRTQLEFSPGHEGREIVTVRPEAQYDCNIIADIPANSFLILSPSTDAQLPSSMGRAFLVRDAAAERVEDLLLIVARPYRL